MNSCILMAKIVRAPELRYTQDTQQALAQMLVEFSGLRPEDPPSTLKVIGWGNLATEIQQKYSEGDQIIIEGRLAINLIDRPEGFKDKRAELTAYKIYRLDGPLTSSSPVTASAPKATSIPTAEKVVSLNDYKPKQSSLETPDIDDYYAPPEKEKSRETRKQEIPSVEENLDEIPF
jgi:single-stranded DNA-binding protein